MNKYLVALNLIPNIGFKRSKQLLDHFGGKYENIFKVPAKTISDILGMRKTPDYNPHEILEKTEEEIEKANEAGIKIITIEDNEYPDILKQTHSPPIVLYTKGDISCLERPCVSIVGTRNPTDLGIKNAKELAAELSKYNITIVSGFAMGIDTAAHESTVDNGGLTCAVLGCGLDIDYPVRNKQLREGVVNNGCLISEFALGVEPRKQNFPRRNRIIAGLSRACVMVEGAVDSGALITANLAFEMNRNVFAFPGHIENDKYGGTNKLIKKNVASLITCHNDLLDELGGILNLELRKRNIKEKLQENLKNLSDIEKKILKCLDYFDAKHIDFITEETKLAVNVVGQVLLSLELKGHVMQKPGKMFVRS